MTRLVVHGLFCALVVGLLGAGCSDEPPPSPTQAQQTYGASVDAADALPASAIVAEADRYVGRRVSIDGRIARVAADGCVLVLKAEDGVDVHVDGRRSGPSACAWQLPSDTDGIAVATGTLRVERDTLRLAANGVQVTPVHVAEPDS